MVRVGEGEVPGGVEAVGECLEGLPVAEGDPDVGVLGPGGLEPQGPGSRQPAYGAAVVQVGGSDGLVVVVQQPPGGYGPQGPGSGDHRDLHSFPTRRSSDLVVLSNRWTLEALTDGLYSTWHLTQIGRAHV